MNILISAGPMRTYLDPIRYIQNSSSGLLGLEITAALAESLPNSKFTALVGPVDSSIRSAFSEITTVCPYATAAEYERALKEHFPNCDLFISCAAVLDFEVQTLAKKISRVTLESNSELTFKKTNVPDFAAWMGNDFKKPNQRIFAFSLDTENEAQAIMRGKDKIDTKNVDWIFVNFASDTLGPEKPLSSGVILNRKGDIAKRIPENTKKSVAGDISKFLVSELSQKTTKGIAENS